MQREGLPRPLGGAGLRIIAGVAAAALLTGLFVVGGLPYDRLAAALAARVARSTPLTLEIQQLGPHLSLLGPGVEARGLEIGSADGVGLRIDALRLRPAWSPRWLLLRPAFRVAAEIAGGSIDGTLGTEPSFAGWVAQVDLAALPAAAIWPGAGLAGRLDATLDLRAGDAGLEGTALLDARDGTVTVPDLPLPLAFQTLTARLALGGDALLRVEELHVSGQGVEALVEGELGRAPSVAQAPLDLRIEIEVAPALRAPLQGFGVRLGADGRGTLHVTGTPDRPVVE